jgi:hypothetical protein
MLFRLTQVEDNIMAKRWYSKNYLNTPLGFGIH